MIAILAFRFLLFPLLISASAQSSLSSRRGLTSRPGPASERSYIAHETRAPASDVAAGRNQNQGPHSCPPPDRSSPGGETAGQLIGYILPKVSTPKNINCGLQEWVGLSCPYSGRAHSALRGQLWRLYALSVYRKVACVPYRSLSDRIGPTYRCPITAPVAVFGRYRSIYR